MLCVKGRFGITELVNHPTRLEHPLAVNHEGTLPVSWEQALETAAEKISACAPGKYGMLISADCSNETLYVARKFVREVVRSNHLRTSSTASFGKGLQAIQHLSASAQPLSTISAADIVLCLGFDGQYAQSVVDVELHRAKRSGAKLITLNAREHSLGKVAEEWLRPEPGEEADVLEMLVEGTRGSQNRVSPVATQVQRVADMLLAAKQVVILVGSGFLAHPDNRFLLSAVERLVAQTAAQLILLPDPVNLTGAFRTGIVTPATTAGLQDLEVLHLVGETIPSHLADLPFILYQNIYPPRRDLPAGLVLPAAAFTEEDGTFLDHSGRMRSIQRAVPAPGEALPSWKILCQIAQKLGVSGFDYEDAAQIRAEFETMTSSGLEPVAALPGILQPAPDVFEWTRPHQGHSYMGFPLGTWVAGFRMLYPESE
jgi:NADH dehydrogenase/NADH:ubiquinone oxidoreductase subunit G